MQPAIERARARGLDPERVEFRLLSAIDLEPEEEGPFDAAAALKLPIFGGEP